MNEDYKPESRENSDEVLDSLVNVAHSIEEAGDEIQIAEDGTGRSQSSKLASYVASISILAYVKETDKSYVSEVEHDEERLKQKVVVSLQNFEKSIADSILVGGRATAAFAEMIRGFIRVSINQSTNYDDLGRRATALTETIGMWNVLMAIEESPENRKIGEEIFDLLLLLQGEFRRPADGRLH